VEPNSRIFSLEKGKTENLLFKKVEQNKCQRIWLHLSTFQKSRAKQMSKDLAPPFYFSKKYSKTNVKGFGSTFLLFKKVQQNKCQRIWLHLSQRWTR